MVPPLAATGLRKDYNVTNALLVAGGKNHLRGRKSSWASPSITSRTKLKLNSRDRKEPLEVWLDKGDASMEAIRDARHQ